MSLCGEQSDEFPEVLVNGSGVFRTVVVSGELTEETADTLVGFYREIEGPALVVLIVNVVGGDFEKAKAATDEITKAEMLRKVFTVAVIERAKGAGLILSIGAYLRLALTNSEIGDLRGEFDEYEAMKLLQSSLRKKITEDAFYALRQGRVFSPEAAECFGLVHQTFPSLEEAHAEIRKVIEATFGDN
jgi:hypothetical protein